MISLGTLAHIVVHLNGLAALVEKLLSFAIPNNSVVSRRKSSMNDLLERYFI